MWCKSMKEINSRFKQRGAFAIEFSIVGLLFAVLLAFSSDVIIKIAMKGKLDRLSFSAVSVVKERTQLYAEDYSMSNADISSLYNVLKYSMKRTTDSFEESKFGMLFEEQTYTSAGGTNALKSISQGSNACSVTQPLSAIENELSVTTTWGRKSTLYRVTLCYETDNGVAGMLDNGFTTVTSSSVILGR